MRRLAPPYQEAICQALPLRRLHSPALAPAQLLDRETDCSTKEKEEKGACMFRKRQSHKTDAAPVQQGNWPAPPRTPGEVPPGPYPPPSYGSAQPVMPPPVPAAMIALLLLSADYRRAEELLRALEQNMGRGRYAVTWVETIEDLLGAMRQRRYSACLLDLASPQVARLEGNYQILGGLPYLAVLTTPSLSDGDPLLQQLDARGYYAYIGYPFDGPAVDHVLTEIFRQMARAAPTPAPQASNHYSQAPAVPGAFSPAERDTRERLAQAPQAMPTGTSAAYEPPRPPLAPPPTPVPPGPPPAPGFTGPLPVQMSSPPASAPPASLPMPSGGAAPVPPGAAPPRPAPTVPQALPVPDELAPTMAVHHPPAPQTPVGTPPTGAELEYAPTLPATPAPPAAPAGGAAQKSVIPFAIQPQLIRHRGLFVCWSPFDGAQRTAAALNLATALAFGGFRTLVGELRRPAGPLASYLQLTRDELSRSLFAAASASERLMKQKGYVIDQELLENHLLNAIPLDPHSDESPEVHFFLSGSAASPQLLFNAPALDPNQSPFVPELLQMIRQYWDYAFIVVGSSPVDKLHWQAFRACDRLLVFLPPDAAYLRQAEQLLPVVLRAAKISPANVDVILTQADRGLLSEQLEPVLRFMAKHAQAEEHQQMSSLRGVLPRRHPQMEEKYLRMLDRYLRKLSEDGTLRGRIEEDVRSMLNAAGLEDKLAGILPDALPLMRGLRRQSRLLLPAVMQREFAGNPYVLAIRDLLGAWVQLAGTAPTPKQQAAR